MALMAPPVPFEDNPMPAISNLGMGWISIQPFAFFYKDQPSISRGKYQWWGERRAGIKETVRLAREAGLNVMLKPQLWATISGLVIWNLKVTVLGKFLKPIIALIYSKWRSWQIP